MATGERHDLAVFIDFENIALGMRGRTDQVFHVQRVLQRLLEKGNILIKRAYADWSRFGSYTKPFHEAAIELIEIPRRGDAGKNSADIRMCVDAMDLCYAKVHIDTFVLVSGDSDFSPLVSKLRENGKRVIGLGLRGSTSELLVANCDEFLFYESLEPQPVPKPEGAEGAPVDKESLMELIGADGGRAAARGARPDPGLARQGHHQAQAAVVQRERVRLQFVHRRARGRDEPQADRPARGPAQRHLPGQPGEGAGDAVSTVIPSPPRHQDTKDGGIWQTFINAIFRPFLGVLVPWWFMKDERRARVACRCSAR